MNRRRAVAAVLPLLAACPGGTEPEDCDADDLAEGDPDCDDVDRTSRRRRRTGGGSSGGRRR